VEGTDSPQNLTSHRRVNAEGNAVLIIYGRVWLQLELKEMDIWLWEIGYRKGDNKREGK
jgi:hypothetical protein